MTWGIINSTGLLISLIGVGLLFRFGIPYHVDLGGMTYLVDADPPDEVEVKKAKRYRGYGWAGLALIIAGTMIQTWVSLATM